jgi:hypothetical protein
MRPRSTRPTNITGKLPRATLAQRLAALSESQLMDLATTLSRDPAQDSLCTTVLETLESRVAGPTFEAFVAEIFPTATT